MSTSKIKSIIIFALLLLNAALLVTVLADREESEMIKQSETQAILEVLDGRNMTLSSDVELDISSPLPCTVYRNEHGDDKLISRFIGRSYREDMGGNVIFYSSDKGQAMMRGTADMILIFHEDMPELGDDHVRSVVKYMGRKGVSLYGSLAESGSSGENSSVVAPCAFNDYCVYNSSIIFTISGDKLMMIEGTRVFDGETKINDGETISATEAIMCFLDAIRSEGIICREIKGLEAGYFMNVAVLGECTLRPVWKVSTDTGDIYINALNGKYERLSPGYIQ